MSQLAEFKLTEPLPKYRATDALARNLIEYILTGGFFVGSKFLSDNDIVTVTGRSRTAVRRALDILQSEGWIERRGAKGTFVGKKLAEHRDRFGDGPMLKQTITSDDSCSAPVIRVAVTATSLRKDAGKNGHGWYLGGVLQGIDEKAAQCNISLEILGFHGSRSANFVQRTLQNPPHIFLCVGPPVEHTPVIALAARRKIPCVMVATRTPETGLPNIFEDSRTAARDAVAHLATLGHTRIGYLQIMSQSGWWSFDRYDGYLDGLQEFSLDRVGEQGLWMTQHPTPETADMVRRYIERCRLSAVICGSFWAVKHLSELVMRDGLKIPRDLSCVVFDQEPSIKYMLGGVEPTTIRLPMREMGIAFAEMARNIVDGKEIPAATVVPCQFIPGDSVIDF